ncbi:hypothetical protein Avbf_16289 [Armadillidium vulgare]|nr:hypothetical protein Avbf_16289 [Armadillidium vulgare]
MLCGEPLIETMLPTGIESLLHHLKGRHTTEKNYGKLIEDKSDHLSDEYFEKQQWQKFNRQPWVLVEQIWKETSANRILVIHQKDEKYHKQYFA